MGSSSSSNKDKPKNNKLTPDQLKIEQENYKKLPFDKLPGLHVVAEFINKPQTHIPDTEPMLKKEHLYKFEQRNGKGFEKNAKYLFVVTIEKQIRFAVISKKNKKGKNQNPFYKDGKYKSPVGHSSLLPQNLYDLAYDFDKEEAQREVAKYSGNFWTDGSGAIKEWDNDSGHFQPFHSDHAIIQDIFNLPASAKYVKPQVTRAHQELFDMFRDGRYYQSGAEGIYNHYDGNLEFMPNMAMERSDNDYYSHSQPNIGYYNNVNHMFENEIGAVIICVAIVFLFCITCMVSMVCGVVFGYSIAHKTDTQSSKSEMSIVVD